MAAQPQGVAPPSPGELRLHGERIVDAVLFGEACRIGSTPPSSVITVDGVVAVPSVATSITASPFCKSPSVAAGMWLMTCWKSDPPARPIPPLVPGPAPAP